MLLSLSLLVLTFDICSVMSRPNSPSARDIEEGVKQNIPSDSEETAAEDRTDSFLARGEKETPPAVSGPPKWVNDAPDGGTWAWLCVLGAWCTSFCSFGWLNSIGAFQEYYQTGPLHQYDPSTIAWIPSLQIFFMFATVSCTRNVHPHQYLR